LLPTRSRPEGTADLYDVIVKNHHVVMPVISAATTLGNQ
jgi:hypothetical protein